ncbi:beta-2 adrenergic receptor-like [Clytia hemisphaerica]|uniref:beta-2 adrenergic receptor-like n=1 Tax=Clytia hemisphaerica TaxID=252671 RepID=UPI0034D3C3C7
MEQYYTLDILETSLYSSFQLAFFIQSFLVILSNGFCLYFVLSRRSLRNRCSSWFVVGLLFSHVLMGSAFIVYFILTKIEGGVREMLNEYQVKMREVAFISSFIFLVIVSLDRYFDIKRPFYYVSLTWKYPSFLLCGALFCIFGYFAFVVYTDQMDTTSTCIVAVSTMSVFSAANYTLFQDMKKQRRKIIATVVTSDDQERIETLKRMKERHLTSLKLSSSITLTFVLCWLPYFLCKVLMACEVLHHKNKLSIILQQSSLLLGGLDPIIMAVLYITLQKREILRNLRCSRTTISTNDNREDSSDYESDNYRVSWI